MSLLPVGTSAVVARNLTPEPERPLPTDPVDWTRNELGESPWSMQRKILRSVVANRRTAVPSAHGTGKSYIAARAAAYWIAAHPLGEAKVVTSAPTGKQISGILWQELNHAHARGGLPGRITGLTGSSDPEWYIGNTLVGLGRKPQDLADLNAARQAFQGMHARYLLVILDEATGVPEWLWEAAQSLLTNEAARMLAIGNPDDAATKFGDVCSPGSGWEVMPVSAFDTPAYTGEVVPEVVREGLVSRAWVEEAERDYGGKDNPLYQSKVLGQFPDTSEERVISPRLVTRARMLDLPGRGRGAYGLDVSRYGKDWSVLYRVRDGVARLVDKWRGLPVVAKRGEESSTSRTKANVASTPGVVVVVDADGIGGGVYDGLIAEEVKAKAFTLNTPARNPKRFDTRRSEVWWEFRKLMEAEGIDLDALDDVLAAQLQAPKWWLDARGRIHVESKKELAKRGVKSPDHADAVIMAALDAPVDLRSPGPLGAYPPAQSKARETVPEGARTRPGEVADIKRRPM